MIAQTYFTFTDRIVFVDDLAFRPSCLRLRFFFAEAKANSIPFLF